MPPFPGDAFRILIRVDAQDLRVAFRRWRTRMNVQLTEMTTEVLVLVAADVLITEEDHLMRHQRVMHRITVKGDPTIGVDQAEAAE